VCEYGLDLMMILISSKSHFHGQKTVDNHTNEIDHQNNGTCNVWRWVKKGSRKKGKV